MLRLSFILISLCSFLEGAEPTLGVKRDAAVRLQIFLDQNMFGPGFIDGRPGLFTKRAIAAYNRSRGRAENDLLSVQEEADTLIHYAYATASIPRFAEKFVNSDLPYKREEQAKEEALHYRSFYEFMAERYHTSEEVLDELNGKEVVRAATLGSLLIVPNVEPFRIEKMGRGRTYRSEDSLSQRRVVIDTGQKQIQFFELAESSGTQSSYFLLASFPTTPGQEKFIHRGTWKLRNSVEWPEWRYDKKLLKEGTRGKEALEIAGGPNNPIGVIWAGLSKSGIGIHGTDNPRTIGRARSSGCFRLANWDAARLPQLIRPGATVIIK